jgi:hypothetical protein
MPPSTPNEIVPPEPSNLEEKRFAFEQSIESQKLHLEVRKLHQAKFDTWTKFLSTIVVGVIVTAGVQFYTWSSDRSAKARAEVAERAATARAQSAQRSQVAIQLTNSRERALSDLRAQMFNSLLQNYFKQANNRDRIAILELMALNFRDAVQIRPMLDLLESQIRATSRTAETAALIYELRHAAHIIIRDQLEQIRQTREGAVCSMKLEIGVTANPDCFPLLSVRLTQVIDASKIAVQTNSSDGALLSPVNLLGSFEVSSFDMPMIDYTTVRSANSQAWRYSILLHNVAADQKSAEIWVALLPNSAVDAERRYAFDEILDQFLNPPDTEQEN